MQRAEDTSSEQCALLQGQGTASAVAIQLQGTRLRFTEPARKEPVGTRGETELGRGPAAGTPASGFPADTLLSVRPEMGFPTWPEACEPCSYGATSPAGFLAKCISICSFSPKARIFCRAVCVSRTVSTHLFFSGLV